MKRYISIVVLLSGLVSQALAHQGDGAQAAQAVQGVSGVRRFRNVVAVPGDDIVVPAQNPATAPQTSAVASSASQTSAAAATSSAQPAVRTQPASQVASVSNVQTSAAYVPTVSGASSLLASAHPVASMQAPGASVSDEHMQQADSDMPVNLVHTNNHQMIASTQSEEATETGSQLSSEGVPGMHTLQTMVPVEAQTFGAQHESQEVPFECSAVDPALYESIKIQPINDDNVKAFQDHLKAITRTRSNVRFVATLGAAAGATYLGYRIYRHYYPTQQQQQQQQQQQLTDLQTQMNTLNQQIQALQQAQANNAAAAPAAAPAGPSLTGLARLKAETVNGAKWVGGGLWNMKDWILRNAMYGYMGAATIPIIWNVLPDVNKACNYLFENRGMSWCLSAKTKFFFTVNGLRNWAVMMGNMPQCQSDLSTNMKNFVEDIEKVLGYMDYITEQLKDSHVNEKARAVTSKQKIRDYVTVLIENVNQFIVMQPSMENNQAMANMIRQALFSIVMEFENFSMVLKAVGYDIVKDQNCFDRLKEHIMPEIGQQRNLHTDDDDELKEMLSGMAKDVSMR